MMDINKKIKQKHKKRARSEKVEQFVYKILTPIIRFTEYIDEKEYKKKEAIREAGRNMSMDEAVDISIDLIIEKLIKCEEDINLVVAEFGDYECEIYTSFRFIKRCIPFNNKNKKYMKLEYYICKNEKYGEGAIEINREFTEAIYNKIKNCKDLKVEWVVDKDKYGYFRSRKYEKTLVIGLKEN